MMCLARGRSTPSAAASSAEEQPRSGPRRAVRHGARLGTNTEPYLNIEYEYVFSSIHTHEYSSH
eukprot:469766-Prymnesium_polylepis.1